MRVNRIKAIAQPPFERLATPDFKQFRELSEEYYRSIDPEEVLDGIEYDDIANAEMHPNGFFIIRLSDYGQRNNGQLRIHLWQPTAPANPANGELHKHPWHLGSMVLLGTYVEHFITVKPAAKDSANFKSIRMDRNPATGMNQYADVQFVDVEISDAHLYQAGKRHYVPERAFHYAPPPENGLSITMPLMGKVISAERRFLAPTDTNPQPQSEPHHHAAAEDVDLIWQQLEAAKG